MIKPQVAFITYGVHKDGLQDPMGQPFIDEKVVADSKTALRKSGMKLTEHKVVIASKEEAREALAKYKKDDRIDAVVLFAGTWVWSAHMIGAIRDFCFSDKAVVIWTHPGSQGWRPVGGLVLHGAMKEVGLPHRFVYGAASDPSEVDRIASYCRAAHLRRALNQSTVGVFGGRGMGQSCGVADPSQWMRMFGVDIDSRDTTDLLRTAEKVSSKDLAQLEKRVASLFGKAPKKSVVNERSMRLYLAIKEIVEKENWDFYTIQSFPGLADDYCASCFAQSMMLEDGVGTSTLSDFNTLLSSLLMTKLSKDPVYYGDLQHINKEEKEIKIIGDGACPPSLAGKLGPAGFAEHGIPTEGEAGGLSVELVCKVGKGALARAGRNTGEFEMVVVPCDIFEPPAEKLMERRRESGIPFWPHGFVRYHADSDAMLEAWNNEYACLGYGEHLAPALVDFCELTGMKAIVP